MSDTGAASDVAVLESRTKPLRSTEYDFAMAATVRLAGTHGTLRIRRRYFARPRHNDVIEWTGADSNDELLDRADELYVHSKYYAVTGDGDEYFLDDHATWRPADTEALAEETAFRDECERHHCANLATEYATAIEERDRKTRERSRSEPEGSEHSCVDP